MEIPDSSSIEVTNEHLLDVIAGFLLKIGETKETVLISISGIGASGKSTLAKQIAEKLGQEIAILETDDYLISKHERRARKITAGNPVSTKLALLKKHLEELKQGKSIMQPVYDGEVDSREFKPPKYVILEGTWALSDDYQHLFDLKIYIECDIVIQRSRRLERDTVAVGEKRQSEKGVLDLLSLRQEEFDKYIAPNKIFADLVLATCPDFTMEVIENKAGLEM